LQIKNAYLYPKVQGPYIDIYAFVEAEKYDIVTSLIGSTVYDFSLYIVQRSG